MKRVDLIISLVFFLLGIWVLWQATMLPTFSVFGPGPEFMPNVLAVVLLISSTILFVTTLRKARQAGESLMPDRAGVNRIVVIITAIFLYVFLMEKLGYRETTFLYCLAMFLSQWRQRWYYSLALSLILTFTFSYAFGEVLDVPIPEGVLDSILGA